MNPPSPVEETQQRAAFREAITRAKQVKTGGGAMGVAGTPFCNTPAQNGLSSAVNHSTSEGSVARRSRKRPIEDISELVSDPPDAATGSRRCAQCRKSKEATKFEAQRSVCRPCRNRSRRITRREAA